MFLQSLGTLCSTSCPVSHAASPQLSPSPKHHTWPEGVSLSLVPFPPWVLCPKTNQRGDTMAWLPCIKFAALKDVSSLQFPAKFTGAQARTLITAASQFNFPLYQSHSFLPLVFCPPPPPISLLHANSSLQHLFSWN